MKESERLLELARKEFEEAAEAKDPTQMKVHAEMGHHYLSRAQAALSEEKDRENGKRNGA